MRSIFPLLAAALLCACGQKGNLYLPDQQPEAVGNTGAAASSPAPATPAAGAAGAIDTTGAAADPAIERERENAARNRN